MITANFVPADLAVIVAHGNETMGTVTIDKPENKVGDQVTITAFPLNQSIRFTGWTNENGDTVSHDSKWTFTISTQDVYTAHFDVIPLFKGPGYYRLYHNGSYLELEGNYSVKGSDQSGVLKWAGKINYSNASQVYYVSGQWLGDSVSQQGGMVLDQASLSSQGCNTQETTGSTLTVNIAAVPSYYKMYALGKVAVLKDNDNGKVYIGDDLKDDYYFDKTAWWIFEPLTEEYIDQYYFGAAPGAKVMKDGKYYTTMYTAFPYKLMDGVKAYYVSGIEDGKLELVEIEGKVPANTAVLLECNGTAPKGNRLLPLMENVPQVVSPETNLLKGVISLNTKEGGKSGPSFDSTSMRVLSTTSMAFTNVNNNTTGYVTNNTCYLQVDASAPAQFTDLKLTQSATPKPLSNIINNSDVTDGDTVLVADNDLTCVYATQTSLYAKDDNGYSPKEALAADQSDYMGNVGFGAASTYDQSNWVQIDLAAPAASIDDSQAQYVGKKLTAVSGILDSKTPNAVIRATANPVAGNVDADYPINGVDDREDRINTYVTSSFIGSQISASGKNTFFMSPKAMEIADVTWAMWDEALQAFVVPVGTGANRGGFSGGFKVDMSMNEQPIAVSDLQDGKVYRFRALITAMATASGARKRAADSNAEVSTKYLVYPLTLTNSGTSIITSVVDVEAAREVAGVKYYNMQGMESAQPFTGVNVVVTTYTDGSRATTKVVK